MTLPITMYYLDLVGEKKSTSEVLRIKSAGVMVYAANRSAYFVPWSRVLLLEGGRDELNRQFGSDTIINI